MKYLCAIVLASAAISTCWCTKVAADTEELTALNPTDDGDNANKEQIKKYLATMDNIDLDQLLNNTRLMTSHIKCLLDEGPCTAQTKESKKLLPTLIKDSCSSCTKEQKKRMKKMIDTVKTLRPNDYKRLSKFFDPEGKHEQKFLDNLNESE
ncbi:Insect odorant-binding protein A10/Ejaculatory bulb-specific protein 3 [Cinara cedri]|uniref:Insect odorant-binding protein A10/Ejaculatory bulb-specific protein 3 n=1 Tax=Cinara cedri TaxID=506608 RepID=A0A5E4LXD3_9HEMI|nr:Insect odorant-binding protein A10/Ejaculatory bulb-specific protein 3 [Cinara cedri]